jgi:aminoglycoside phosphotransferase family enzyme
MTNDNPSITDDLLRPASLPDKTESVSLVQTHISLVFVADEFVYKVKKQQTVIPESLYGCLAHTL